MIKIRSALCATLILTACDKQSALAPDPTPPAAPRTFAAKGVVKELEADGKTVVIQHEAISNYMGAMTMPFEVRDPKELRGLKAGDAISFHLIVTSNEGWIDSITLRPELQQGLPAPTAVHVSRAVAPLDEG